MSSYFFCRLQPIGECSDNPLTLRIQETTVGRRRNTKVGSNESMDYFPKHVWEEYEKGDLAAMTVASRIEEKDREKAEKMSMVDLWCVQDSPDTRPPMSAMEKMMEGGV